MITDPEHVKSAKAPRIRFFAPVRDETGESLERNLADDDTAFGVSFDQSEQVA
jgi:hypothetical protein